MLKIKNSAMNIFFRDKFSTPNSYLDNTFCQDTMKTGQYNSWQYEDLAMIIDYIYCGESVFSKEPAWESVDLVVGRADNAKQKNHLHFFYIEFQGLSFIIQDAISILMRRLS